jgi:hypothetical protein
MGITLFSLFRSAILRLMARFRFGSIAEPEYATLQLEMWNEHRQYFTDSFSLGFNVKFYRTIKVHAWQPLGICQDNRSNKLVSVAI